jgi:hypothetical protein
MGCSFPKHFSDIEKIDEDVQRGIVSYNICNDFLGEQEVVSSSNAILQPWRKPLASAHSTKLSKSDGQKGPKREKGKIPKQYPKL